MCIKDQALIGMILEDVLHINLTYLYKQVCINDNPKVLTLNSKSRGEKREEDFLTTTSILCNLVKRYVMMMIKDDLQFYIMTFLTIVNFFATGYFLLAR